MSHPAAASDEPSPDTMVELVWPDDTGADAVAVNQIVISNDQNFEDVVYLYFGHVAPPPWLAPEVTQRRLTAMEHKLPVAKKGSFMLGRSRAEELWTALGRHLGKLPPA